MRLALVALVAGLAPALALAAPTRVRTAEHDGFTRVVVDFRPRPDWSLDREAGELVLRTDAANLSFDLGDAYRRIQRTRVTALADLGGGELRFDLGCDCEVETMELANQSLVIDILDGDGREQIALPPTLESAPRDLVVAPGLLRDIGAGDPLALLRHAQLARVRSNVEQGVDRAVAQGVTRPSSAPAGAPPAEVRPDPGGDLPDLSAFDNIRVGTQIDRDRRERDGQDADCPPKEWFAISGWGAGEVRLEDVAARRLAAFGAEGGPSSDGIRDLARGLLYVTFGTEAAGALHLDPAPSQETEALGRIAALIDGAPADAAAFPYSACGGAASMWALIGGQALPEAVLQSALGAFDAMPAHLRRHLGPRLARRLVAQGRTEEARLIERAMGRDGAAPDAEAAFAAAEISHQDGRDEEAREILEGVATSGLPQAGEAMADLLASLGAGGETAPNTLIDQAMALSFELDGAVGRKLDAEITLALGRNERFTEAMGYLYARDVETGLREDLRDDLYDLVLEAGDVAFLETAARMLDGPRPGEVEALAMAARLADHGVVAQARAYLDGIAGPPRREERLIRARLAKVDGDAASAATYLAGLEGPEVAEIRDGLNLPPELPAALDAVAAEAPDQPPPLAGVPSLSERSRELLSESAALREALSGLTGGAN